VKCFKPQTAPKRFCRPGSLGGPGPHVGAYSDPQTL